MGIPNQYGQLIATHLTRNGDCYWILLLQNAFYLRIMVICPGYHRTYITYHEHRRLMCSRQIYQIYGSFGQWKGSTIFFSEGLDRSVRLWDVGTGRPVQAKALNSQAGWDGLGVALPKKEGLGKG